MAKVKADHVSAVGIVNVADGDVSKVMKIAVEKFVDRPFGSFNQVAKDVDPFPLIQYHHIP